jgi:ribose 5-phosphate isomerase B
VKIIIGSDQNGFALKNTVIEYLKSKNIDISDIGVYDENPVNYPEIAEKLALKIADGSYERGILICGTGIGMAIVANKIPGVRAAVCHDIYSAERARKSNDAQIMTMGAQIVGPELAKLIVDGWIKSEFTGGRSTPKVDMINKIDHKYHQKYSA